MRAVTVARALCVALVTVAGAWERVAWGQAGGSPAGGPAPSQGETKAAPGPGQGIILVPSGDRQGAPGFELPPEVRENLRKALEARIARERGAHGAPGGAVVQEGGHAPAAAGHGRSHGPSAKGAVHAYGPGAQMPHGKATSPHEGHHVNWIFLAREGEEQPFLATLFNFLVLALLFGRFAVPPLREFVRARHEKIAKELAEANRLRLEAEERLKEYEARIANIDQEIAALVSGLRAEGEAERDRIIAAAEEQAKRLRQETEMAIAQEMRRARKEVEREIVLAALAAAEKMLKERVTEADHRMLLERSLVALSTTGPDGHNATRGAA